MDLSLAQNAVKLALEHNWKEAIKVNLEILKNDPADTEALNRLARAYFESGDFKKAKKQSEKVLCLDPTNKIAFKFLEKHKNTKSIGESTNQNLNSNQIDPSVFIEEPGKTKLANLLNLGAEKIISNLDCGDEVLLSTHSHRVTISTLEGSYVGKLPDDLSAKLRTLVKGGNLYKVFIKSIDKNQVKVFIREIKRSSNFQNIPSFPRENLESVGELASDSQF